ncbi:cysteine hydrolase [Sphingobium fuliginis ATCC 27551]|uniref:Cysteine hydrolase n=1 Tax=Sphingobium fuliginis ATCC 27551 TaxID=1208342 RepID=A0A5B8CM89_SPHSA|nr:cysteine hydrolase [Sphingobium fuliginis ATCC 27551]
MSSDTRHLTKRAAIIPANGHRARRPSGPAYVESTARDAYDLGYNVTIVADATTDTSVDLHTLTVQKIFPRLGQIATEEQISRLLAQR